MNEKANSKLWLYFAGLVFLTITAVFALVTALWLVLYRFQLISIDPRARHIPILALLGVSLLIGGSISIFVGKVIIRPIQNISNAFEELSKGNFDVKVPENEKITEIKEMARRFNAMTYDLSHIETLRNDFVANVSHEFKTPIAAIEGYAMLLQNSKLPREKHEHYVNKIIENSQRLTSLSGNILLLSKLENQENILDNKEFRLDEQLRKSVLLLENKWTEKNIEFDIDLQKQIYYGSEQLLSQVWVNIIDNAIKHSPMGGVIYIGISQTDDAVTVTVTDHGDGMSEEVQKHIMEKFYQGDRSRKAEGNGLGLALVKRIVELSRGTVEVESSPGNGASFSVILPVKKR